MFNYEQVHLNSKHRLDKTYLDYLHPDFKEIGHSGNIITKNDLYFIELNTLIMKSSILNINHYLIIVG